MCVCVASVVYQCSMCASTNCCVYQLLRLRVPSDKYGVCVSSDIYRSSRLLQELNHLEIRNDAAEAASSIDQEVSSLCARVGVCVCVCEAASTID